MTASGRKALTSNAANKGENNNSHSNRKASKPLMEKRRRARINESLTELKKIVVTGAEKDGSSAKLEKADILELTVKYLRDMCEFQRSDSWRNGFDDCVKQTRLFLEESGNCELGSEITSHLETVCPDESPLDAEISSVELEPINLSVFNTTDRKETYVWRPW